jgi:PAS domain S-box-containing protein
MERSRVLTERETNHRQGSIGSTPYPGREAVDEPESDTPLAAGILMDDLFRLRETYLRTGIIPDGVRPMVRASWERCSAYGIDPEKLRRQEVDPEAAKSLVLQSRELLQAAIPYLQQMKRTLCQHPYLLALADSDGHIISLDADEVTSSQASENNFAIGASWNERDIGCNGVGTALITGKPVVLIGPEHYQEAYVGWTCAGVPLRNSAGTLVGVIDLSVPNAWFDPHTWGWLLTIGQAIEAQLTADHRRQVESQAGLRSPAVSPVPDSPFDALRGVLELVGTQLPLVPTHARLMQDAREQVDACERRVSHLLEGLSETQDALDERASQLGRLQKELAERAGHALERSRMLDAIMAHVPAGITIADAPDVRIREVSAFGSQLTGRPAEHLENIAVDDHAASWHLYHADGKTPAENHELPLTRATKNGEVVLNEEWVLERADGSRIVLLCNAAPIRDAGGHITGGLIAWLDITDIQAMRDALLRSEARFRTALKGSPVVVSHCDLDLRYTWVYNPGKGLTPDFMLGRRDDELPLFRDASEMVDFKRYVLRTSQGARREISLQHEDGWHVYDVSAEPLRSSSGALIGLTVASVDITGRKQMEDELRRAKEDLEQRVAERTADLEARNRELQNFAYVASHDMREPLRKIQAFGEPLQSQSGEALGDDGLHYLRRMGKAAARMSKLLDDLLEFSRVETHGRAFEEFPPGEVVEQVLQDHASTIKEKKARVELDLSGTMVGDRRQLHQLLGHLVINALKYHREGESPEILIRTGASDGTRQGSGRKQAAGFTVVVEDNGIGIEERFLDRIFEPFKRLHGRDAYGGGTGMGLAICRRIVERHRGSIRVEPRPERGSRFIVTMPG